MTEEALPVVNRYNPWGFWQPFAFDAMEKFVEVKKEIDEAAADPDLEAALLYTRATGYEGLEFVLLSEHWDETRVHTLNDGIVLIRVWDPPEPPTSRPFLCAYDGWLPVENTGIDALRAALRSLQDFADFFGYQYGVAIRCCVKYRECTAMARHRNTGAEDIARFRDRMSRLQDLPATVRTAILRGAHWHQNAERQGRASDRFIGLWLALESVALVLYENSGLLNLPLGAEAVPQTRRQRRAAQNARVEQILAEQATASPSERVLNAYFQGVVGIRRRVETTLRAILGEDARIQWLYTRNGPSDVRSKLVHEGWSEVDAAHSCDLQDYCGRLDRLFKELVERILDRRWAQPIELSRKSYVGTMDAMNMIPIGSGLTFQGDFSITLQLLASKRILRF